MAALQRKLVHKQFNSPMGLYSQENVKATLNRELKAFGGEGIEVDDQVSKPLNLANSAVLRAVEEEEQQAKSDFYPTERQSRRRQRGEGDALHHTLHQQLLDQIKTDYLSHQQDITIDRDTVLKINRLATKRHLLKRDHSWPPLEQDVASNAESQGHQISCNPSHSIEALREKFQSPTRIIEPTAKQVREQRQREGGSKERSKTPQRVSSDRELSEVFHQTPVSKGFSAPETKAADVDLGLVAPRCEYYEQLAHKRPSTPTLPTPVTPYRPRPKRQAYSLDRGRSRKRTVGAPELPPPKPRTSKPKVQRRCIKLATEVKISYGHDGDSEEEPNSGQDVDLETLPLPPTPAAAQLNQAKTAGRRVIDNLAVKQQQQMALSLATNGSISQPNPYPNPNPLANTRIVPVRVETSTDQLKLSAQQIYDDACSYLQDHQEMEEERESPTYVSATGGIKLLQRQGSSTSAPATPIPVPSTPPPPVMRSKSGQDSLTKEKQTRRQGGIYRLETDTEKQHEAHVEIAQLEAKYAHIQQSIAEHLLQIDAYMENAKQALQRSAQTTPIPTPPPPPPPPPPPLIPARPISSGSNDSWEIFAHRQSPILAAESPLQAILRQIYTRAAGLPTRLSKEIKEETAAEEEAEESLTENVPIVERALEDLHKIAVALEQKPQSAEHMHVELRTTPAVIEAEHVVIKDEDEEVDLDADVDMEYRHVSDVIANYEQLAKKEFEEWKEEQVGKKEMGDVKEVPPKTELRKAIEEQLAKKELREANKVIPGEEKKISIKDDKENGEPLTKKDSKKAEPVIKPELQESTKELEASKTPADLQRTEEVVDKEKSCLHEETLTYCPVCDEMRCSPNNWAKLNKADQWRIANLQNESLKNYKATYEIRSPYISRQISWEDTQSAKENTPPEKLQRQRSFVEIVTTPATPDSPPPTPPPPPPPKKNHPTLQQPETEVTWERSRSPSPLPSRKYPAPLIEAPQRSSSPYGLNPVQTKAPTPSPGNLPVKYSHVPQLEGHNIGLLVRTATEPLQQSMSASSSMLAATPPATPRSAAQPSPFEFPSLESGEQHKFRSLASFDEVQRDFSVNRSFDNVSPRPYLGIEGYKRVAWPPASEERIIREFTPQPQTQSPAPGAGGYYPQAQAQAQAQAHAPSAAAPPQGPIYNNVQPRTTQAPPQNVYAPAPQQPTSQFPDSYPHQQQETQIPVQYTQAQFNRQRSREPVQVPAPTPDPASHANYQSNNYQPNYQSNYPQEQLQAANNVGGGWKHIGAPLPKSRSEFTAGGGDYPPFQGSPQQQQQPSYQQPQQQQQQQQYGGYQQQQQPQQPAAQWQQQPQQQVPQQQYQPQSQAQAPYQPPQWNQQQQQQPPQQQQPSYQASPYPQQQQQQQQQPSYYPQQNGGSTYAQPPYNSYSQPQVPYSQDQTDLQQQQQQLPGAFAGQDSYRGASPGIITLRKEAPVSQQPAPVYSSQPAAVSYQGGSKLRGDLKWPPPEYKEAAARENEERRQLALGPVCRPRRINRQDYTPFFAKHQLNNGYPSYKVPPGTQHIFG
ncbi:titin isoform X1 [Drosophila subpulchrella]|uniref:titin isoform X1 n=1 Tax=Drosophila subpulchrella TaxID=1486046 RepID=UPI0018A19A17|nr:titin isoform X1 [Drosophila subpulchrella]XP_037723038.1 titin isoform X1 [Drosophila subpulchrella]